ncbi:MAG TPA: extracellular solute-binding protein [Isoptericola sp.]|nr:extracellular solute-binding protein [Isoptericola sp.]
MTHHPTRRRAARATAAVTALGLAATLSACGGSDDDPGATAGPVTLRVQGMPPATDAAGQEAFQATIDEFEAANPDITIEATTNEYDPLTFSAQLAGGSIEDVIRVPLTEPQGLIQRTQVADLTEHLAAWPHYEELNPQVLEPLSDDAGNVYGVPRSPFAMGLAYNRALFEKAGLDPDDPPETWDEVRAAAKAIAEKTDAAGFVHESKDNQGGWQLTMLTYAFGGALESRDGDTVTPTLQTPEIKAALDQLHEMRWTDDSMGSQQLLNQDDVVRDFAAGQVGMFMGTPGTYKLAKQNFGMKDTEDFGMAAMPQAGGDATMSGGEVFMVPANVDAAKQAAAVKWMLFAYAQPQYDPEVAASQAETLAKDPTAAVGVPTLPMFDAEHQATIDAAIEPWVNVELEHFTHYTEGTPQLTLQPEPTAGAQAIYAVLDTVVQAVLTEEDADVDALLAEAQAQAEAQLASS